MNEAKFGKNMSEDMSYPDKRLKLVLEDFKKTLTELQNQIDLGNLKPEQCIDIENKIRKLYVELINNNLLPQNIAKPIE